MSLDNYTDEGRHLTLYQTIEDSLSQPKENKDKNSQNTTGFSTQFFASTHKKTKKGVIALLFVLLIVLVGVAFQYLPFKQLDPYRPTELAKQLQQQAVSQANALSTHMNYDRCIEKGGMRVEAKPSYCILNNYRYYQGDTVLTKEQQIAEVGTLLLPVRSSEMTLLKNIQTANNTMQVYSGYSDPTSTAVAQYRTLPNSALSTETLTQMDTLLKGEGNDVGVFLRTVKLTDQEFSQYSTVLSSVGTTTDISAMYPGFALRSFFVAQPTALELHTSYLIVVAKNIQQTVVMMQPLQPSFSQTLQKLLHEECSNQKPEELEVCYTKVLSDKSIAEKLAKEHDRLLQYLAITR